MASRTRGTARALLSLTIVGSLAFALDIAWGTGESPAASAAEGCESATAPPPQLPPSVSPSESPSESPSPSSSPSLLPELGPTERCASKISIRFRRVFNDQDPRNRFFGFVSSDNETCEPARPVVLKKVKRGADQVVGRTTTNDRGRWRILEPSARGRFYAKVRKSEGTSGESPVVCLSDRSRTVRVR